MKGAQIEKIKALHMRQDMQKDYVKEQEIRYTDMINKYNEMHAMYHEIKDKKSRHSDRGLWRLFV